MMDSPNLGKLAREKMYRTFLTRISNGDVLKASEMRTFRDLEAEIERGRKEAEGPDPGPQVFAADEAVATFAGVSRHAVKLAVRRGRLCQQPDGTFTRAEVDSWLKRRRPTRSYDATPDKDRLAKAKADLVEMERDELRGKLLRRADVERAFTDRAHEFARSLWQMGRRIGKRVAGKSKRALRDVLAIFEEEARAMLDAYTRPLPVGKKE